MGGDNRSPQATPVLCLAFNRPDLFEQVVGAVGRAGPRELYVSIDGPRPEHREDAELCRQVRKIAEGIDWAPEVHLKAETRNLGLGPAVTSAISWALSRETELIVLEDDCLPDPSFLGYCDELLVRYRHDERVMQIAGTNWGAARARFAGYSYAFTSCAPVWGWATWRRAWDLYDYELESWPRVKATGLAEGMSVSPRFRRVLGRDWDKVRREGGTWDYQWQYSVLRHHGLSVCPQRNLVKNIGFRRDATQLREPDRIFSRLQVEKISFPLRHPPEVARNAAVEAIFERIYWRKRGWPAEVYDRLLGRNPRVHRIMRRLARTLLPRPS